MGLMGAHKTRDCAGIGTLGAMESSAESKWLKVNNGEPLRT